MKLEKLRTWSEGNDRLWEAWKTLKQFHLVRYDETVGGATLLRMATCVTKCSSSVEDGGRPFMPAKNNCYSMMVYFT